MKILITVLCILVALVLTYVLVWEEDVKVKHYLAIAIGFMIAVGLILPLFVT